MCLVKFIPKRKFAIDQPRLVRMPNCSVVISALQPKDVFISINQSRLNSMGGADLELEEQMYVFHNMTYLYSVSSFWNPNVTF